MFDEAKVGEGADRRRHRRCCQAVRPHPEENTVATIPMRWKEATLPASCSAEGPTGPQPTTRRDRRLADGTWTVTWTNCRHRSADMWRCAKARSTTFIAVHDDNTTTHHFVSFPPRWHGAEVDIKARGSSSEEHGPNRVSAGEHSARNEQATAAETSPPGRFDEAADQDKCDGAVLGFPLADIR
jgi:hypothetical protein